MDDLVSCKKQINLYIAMKLMHTLVHVLPKTRFLIYSILLTLQWIRDSSLAANQQKSQWLLSYIDPGRVCDRLWSL